MFEIVKVNETRARSLALPVFVGDSFVKITAHKEKIPEPPTPCKARRPTLRRNHQRHFHRVSTECAHSVIISFESPQPIEKAVKSVTAVMSMSLLPNTLANDAKVVRRPGE